jgi:hypothetical protein
MEQQSRPVMLLMSWSELGRVVTIGALVGLVTVALCAILDKYVLTPALCSAPEMAARCASKSYFASAIAMVLGAVAGLFALVQQRVYRPLLVILLATVGLWNVALLIVTLPLVVAIIAAALLFAATYGAFAWLAQIRNFVIALIVGIILVVLMRLMLSV